VKILIEFISGTTPYIKHVSTHEGEREGEMGEMGDKEEMGEMGDKGENFLLLIPYKEQYAMPHAPHRR
jgi:hypothetical protein